MSDAAFSGYAVNRVHFRGDPQKATLESGHVVEKSEFVYFRMPVAMGNIDAERWVRAKCADYHGEHFVYLDPLYEREAKPGEKGHWFAACTCGSPAVLVGPGEAELEDTHSGGQLLVCFLYHLTLKELGFGRHTTTGERPWT